VKFRACALIVGCCSLGLLRAAAAADPPVDDGLLEFLGSVDSDDKGWRDYLAGSDAADPVARRVGTAPPSKPAAPPPAAGTPAAADPPAAGAPPPVSYP
jgi:hypothetical protein